WLRSTVDAAINAKFFMISSNKRALYLAALLYQNPDTDTQQYWFILLHHRDAVTMDFDAARVI
ncbi:MAG TPA: hypothetical protein DCX09_03245, partial [Gammaproteobacteria bacterium]|nr:hypothetical protein [Gammaproteobacteria bacterium]